MVIKLQIDRYTDIKIDGMIGKRCTTWIKKKTHLSIN